MTGMNPAGGQHGDLFRFRRAPLMAVGWYAIAAFAGYDLVRRGEGREVPIGVASLALITVIVYATAQRPAIYASPDGVLLRNILRDVWLPWYLVKGIESKWSLVVQTADGSYGSWALTGASASRQRGRPRGRSAGSGPPAEHEMPWTVPDRLEQLRRRGLDGERTGEIEVRPAWPVIGALAVTVVALAALLAVPAG